MNIPGLSVLFEPIQLATIRMNGYVCLAKWDWESVRGNHKQPVSEFKTRFTVPPPPTQQSDQTLFIFHGMQPSRQNVQSKAILQPVLQWGNKKAGGGAFWSVASWYVRIVGEVTTMKIDMIARTKPIPVDPGRILEATITQTKFDGDDLFTSACEFDRIDGTSLTVRVADEFVQSGLALEVYRVDNLQELPHVECLSFENIAVTANGSKIKPHWEISHDSGVTGEICIHNGIEDQFVMRL